MVTEYKSTMCYLDIPDSDISLDDVEGRHNTIGVLSKAALSKGLNAINLKLEALRKEIKTIKNQVMIT